MFLLLFIISEYRFGQEAILREAEEATAPQRVELPLVGPRDQYASLHGKRMPLSQLSTRITALACSRLC